MTRWIVVACLALVACGGAEFSEQDEPDKAVVTPEAGAVDPTDAEAVADAQPDVLGLDVAVHDAEVDVVATMPAHDAGATPEAGCQQGALSCNGNQPTFCTGGTWAPVGTACEGAAPFCAAGECQATEVLPAAGDAGCTWVEGTTGASSSGGLSGVQYTYDCPGESLIEQDAPIQCWWTPGITDAGAAISVWYCENQQRYDASAPPPPVPAPPP